MANAKSMVVKLDGEATEHVLAYMKEVELDDMAAAASDLICVAAGRRAALAKYASAKKAKPKTKVKRAAKK